jgi:hypothetical protein
MWTWADGHRQGHGRGRGHGQMDTDRDMDVDVDMGRSRSEMKSMSRLLPETFCRGDVLLGDVLLWRRFVTETFC